MTILTYTKADCSAVSLSVSSSAAGLFVFVTLCAALCAHAHSHAEYVAFMAGSVASTHDVTLCDVTARGACLCSIVCSDYLQMRAI